MSQPYRYQPNPENLGQGSRALGFVITRMTTPLTEWLAGGAATRRQMHVMQGPQVFAPHIVSEVSLRGNGVYMSGQVVMQQLSDFEKKGGAR